MKRAEKGEKYWFVDFGYYSIYSCYNIEQFAEIDNKRFEIGNYFTTKEDAEVMVEKLRRVFHGASVIDFPGDNDILIEAQKHYPHRWSGDRENGEKLDAFCEGAEWMKTFNQK